MSFDMRTYYIHRCVSSVFSNREKDSAIAFIFVIGRRQNISLWDGVCTIEEIFGVLQSAMVRVVIDRKLSSGVAQ